MELLGHQMQRWLCERGRGTRQRLLPDRYLFPLYFNHCNCVSWKWRCMLYRPVKAPDANRYEFVYCQPGCWRYPDDDLLRSVLVLLDTGAGLLAVRNGYVSSRELFAGSFGAGERIHIGGDQHRPVYCDNVAATTENK